MSDSNNGNKIGPLQGVKVVDLTRPLAGSTCTMILADMGAEIISIGSPGRGRAGGFSYLQRNKKSITLDLRSDKGKEILRRLIEWGDVLVESYRPGIMKKMGFDYPSVREINPRIIMTSLSGYGQNGPYSHRGAFDPVGQAMGGLMSLTGPAEGPPWDAGAAIADLSTAVFAALGTAFALYRQKATGQGQHVESTLVDSIVFFMVPELMATLAGQVVEKGAKGWWKRRPGSGWFQAKDGPYIVIMAQGDQHWKRLLDIMGRSDLEEKPGYMTRSERSENAEEIHEMIEEWARDFTGDEIEAMMDKADIPFGRVQTIEEILKDPNLKARGMFKDVDLGGKLTPLFGPYPILSETPGSIESPPTLGQNNEEIYKGLLRFSDEDIKGLKDEDVI